MSGKGFYDLYLLPGGSNAKAGLPEKLKGDINNKLNEGPATFSRDGREVIFTRTNYKALAAMAPINWASTMPIMIRLSANG